MNRYIGQVCEGRSNNFDFIRFIAASMVIYSHAFPLSRGNDGELLKDITNGQWSFGSLAVAVFFVISGFLISQSYDRKNQPLNFIKARILRIFPGLIVVILLSALVLGPCVTTLPVGEYFRNPITWQYLKSILLFPLYWNLPGCFENNFYSPSVNGSLWTIPFEVFFYGVVLILGILGLLRRRKVTLTCYIGFLLLEMFKYQLFPVEGHIFTFPRYSFVELGLYYFAGMVIYAYRDSIPLNRNYAMISIAALVICILGGKYTIPFSIFGSYLIMYLAFSEKVKLHNFSRYGDFSYGVYIYGFPVQQAVTNAYGGSMNPYINMAWSYPVTIVLAIMSWHLVEKPCMRLKKYGNVSHANGQAALETIQKTIGKISIGWKQFVILCGIVVVATKFYYSAPNIVSFPYNNDSIFLSGWLPQSTTEDYRWIGKDSVVKLEQPTKAGTIVVEGYIPDNFSEISEMNVFVDEKLIYQQQISAGEAINIVQPVDKVSKNQVVSVKIQFNAEHVPDESDADQRTMSALISKIGFE